MSISNIKIYFTSYQLEHINMKHILIISIFPTKSSKKYFVALSTAFRPFFNQTGITYVWFDRYHLWEWLSIMARYSIEHHKGFILQFRSNDDLIGRYNRFEAIMTLSVANLSIRVLLLKMFEWDKSGWILS